MRGGLRELMCKLVVRVVLRALVVRGGRSELAIRGG